MGFNDYLTILVFTFPPVFSLIRYYKKDPSHKPQTLETVGILTCTVAMVLFLFYVLQRQMFY